MCVMVDDMWERIITSHIHSYSAWGRICILFKAMIIRLVHRFVYLGDTIRKWHISSVAGLHIVHKYGVCLIHINVFYLFACCCIIIRAKLCSRRNKTRSICSLMSELKGIYNDLMYNLLRLSHYRNVYNLMLSHAKLYALNWNDLWANTI